MFFAARPPSPALRLPRSPFVLWTLGWLLLAAFVLAAANPAGAGTLYVRADASTDGDGLSWTTACKSLQTALGKVDGTTPTEIWIKTGVYKPTANTDRTIAFVAKSNLIIRGGFVGTEGNINQRPVAATATSFTVLSGDIGTAQPDAITATTNVNDHAARVFDLSATGAKDNSYNVIRVVSAAGFYLDRVVVAGGYADTADVPYADIETSLYPTNAAGAGFRQTLDSRVNGAAIFAHSSSIAVLNCWFVGNYAKGIGGAIVARGGSLQVEGNRFIRNITSFGGGGLCTQGVSLAGFHNNLFYANISAYLGGGALIQGDTANENVKAYESVLLSGIAALTSGNPTLAPPPPATGTVSDIEQAIATVRFLHKNSVKVAKAFQNAAQKTTKFLSSNPSTLSFSSVGSGLSATYAWVSLGVTAVDVGVEIAIWLGADPNDPFIQGWKVFSNGFATYATPTGLAKLAYNALYDLLVPGPSFAQRATELRNKEYDTNHNQAAPFVALDNRFELNHADAYGGGVAVLVQNLVFDRARFIENSADYGGGAGAFFAYNSVDLENSALVGNTSKLGHSALALGFRTASRILNTTLVQNHSQVASGFAIGADSGADVTVANSILWNNTNGDTNSSSNPNRLGGADLFAARYADLDAAGRKAYTDAADSHGMFTGVLDIQYSVVQSLDRLALGSELFHTLNTPENFASLRRAGLLLIDHNPNVGEGIAPVANRGNISRDPVLLQDIYPHPNSPAINAGSRDVYTRGGSQDIDRNSRTPAAAGIIDIGAAESNGTLASGVILYVNAAVSASGDGFSWATAFKTLPEALAQPLAPGGQIWVAGNATYPATGPMILPPGCSLVGGFASGATSLAQSDPVARPTIISGANGATVLLSGLAKIPDIAAYRRMLGLPRIIRGITFQSASSAAVPAAVRLSIPVVVQSCVFRNNTGARALSIEDPNNFYTHAAGQIIDSTFESNLAGAITCPDTNLEVIRSHFYENVAASGAAIHKGNTHSTQWLLLERNVFYHNQATAGRGGAVFLRGDLLAAAHNVFADNTALPAAGDTTTRGGAGLWWHLHEHAVSRYELVNNILYGNRLVGPLEATTPLEFQQIGLSSLLYFGAGTVPVITGNCIEGLNTIAPRGGSAGNVDYDPFFVNPAARDFRLAADSALVNRGSAYVSATDSSVTINGTRDIGSVEDSSTAPRPDGRITLIENVPTDDARTVMIVANLNSAGEGSDFYWEVLRPGATGMTPVVNDAWHSGAGTYLLTITNPPHTWNGSIYRLRFKYPQRLYTNDVVLDLPPSILYVRAGASGDGTSWSNAFGDLWSAIRIAKPFTQIWVSSGTYPVQDDNPNPDLTISAPPGVRFYGGFAGNETTRAQRSAATAPTRFRFTGVNTLSITGNAPFPFAPGYFVPTVFDGITVSGPGTYENYFCLDLNGATTLLNNVKIAETVAGGVLIRAGKATLSGVEGLYSPGTPVTADGAVITVSNSTFTANGTTSFAKSGGLTLLNSTATVTDSLFNGNHRRAVHAAGNGSLTLERSRFLDNNAGALYLAQSGASRVANSLFARNHTTGEGGAIINGSSGAVSLVHLTLVENSAQVGGAIINNGASLTLANSIVWDNNAPTAPAIQGAYTRVASHVQGQVDYAPFFNANPTTDPYRLAGYSPLVNKGSASVDTGATDLLGLARVVDGIPDMGAIETPGTAPASAVYFTSPPVHRIVYEDRPVSYVLAGGVGSTTAATTFSWEYLDASNNPQPIESLSGWTVVRENGTTTLSHPSIPLASNGLRLRLSASGIGIIAYLRLDVLPRKILRVDGDVVATAGNGSTWSAAFKTIGAALAAADGDTDLWIAGSDYPETALTAPDLTRLYVGFAGGETVASARDAAANPVRLVGSASRLTLVPDAAFALPDLTFRIGAAPAALTRYVERPIAFIARADSSASLAWQYKSGANWLPISGLSGWTVTQVGEVSTFAYPAAEITQNGLQLRAIVPGTQEASFETTLTVNPRTKLYVNAAVPASGNGLSWATALKTIGEALARADDGTDIWIATGTYSDRNLAYVPGANLYSGFAGHETSLGDRDPVARPVTLQGPGGAITFGATATGFRYTLATPVRTRTLYIGQPGGIATSLTGSGAAIVWQYLDGSTWVPLTSFPGWNVTTTGLLSKAVHLAFPVEADGLKVRVFVPSTGETSAPVTLTVTTRVNRYVNHAATGTGSGTSWANAHTTLAAALALADDGTDIWIASGTYDEATHSVGSGTHLYGGFAGTETTLAERNPSAPATVLRNGTGNRVLTIDLRSAEFDITTVISGLTIADGTATAPTVYLNGLSMAFDDVTFTSSVRAVFIEGDTTLADFADCVWISNTQAIVSDAGPGVSIDNSLFSQNAQGATFAAGAVLSITDSDFANHSDYAISAAPGFGVGACSFTDNARDIVVTGAGASVTSIEDSTFTGTTVRAIASATPVELATSDFSGVALGLDLTGGAATSRITDSIFANATGDAVRAPAGITIVDTTFTANLRGLVLSASGTAVSTITGGSFANHIATGSVGLQSSGPVRLSGVTVNANATGLLLTAATEFSSITNGVFTGNTTGVSTVSGLTVLDSTFTNDATGLAVTSASSFGTNVKGSTFTGATFAGIASSGRLSTDTVTFDDCALGVSLTGGTGISRFVATTFKDGIAGLNVATPARAELVDPIFTGNSGVSITATGVQVLLGNVVQPNVLVTHGAFSGNTGPVFAGLSGYHKFDRCTFVDNTTASPLLETTGATLAINNSLVARNTATNNSVVHSTGSGRFSIVTSTIVDNETGTAVGAVFGSGTITQSILWDNRASAAYGRVELMQAGDSTEITKSIIEGLQSSYRWTQPTEQNIALDPLFTDARSGDYTLQPYSPAIDLGGSTFATNLQDLRGAARVQSTAVDLGAYESALPAAATPVRLTFPSQNRTIVIGDSATYAVTFATGDGRSIRWQVDTGSGWADLVAGSGLAPGYANGVLRLVVDGSLSLSGYRFRAIISDGSTDIYTSPVSTFTVVPRPIYYVNASAIGAGTGADWANAFTALESALNIAPAFSDIRVAGGTYRAPAGDSFRLRNSQRLLGGWNAATGALDRDHQVSILASAVGAPPTSIILVNDGLATDQTLVEGFTFTAGGTGVRLNQASPVLRDCAFVDLVTGVYLANGQVLVEDSDFNGNTGSAIIARGGDADLVIVGCEFTDNLGGGAIALGNSTNVTEGSQRAVIADSVFTGNSGTRGGAISSINFGSALVVERSRFVANTATERGGAIYGNADNSVTVRQSLFAENQAADGAAIATSGTASIVFTTVARNHATAASGRSINATRGVTVRDSILWGNTTAGASASRDDQIRLSATGGAAVFADTIIEGLSATSGARLLPFDPKFVNAAAGDYRLSADSPAIGRGQSADLLSGETDLDGVTRPAGGSADLGAHEFTATPTAPAYGFNLPTTLTTPVGTGFTFVKATPPGFTSGWDYDDGSGWRAINLIGQPSTGPAGAYSYVAVDPGTGQSTVKFASIDTPLNGVLLRYRLTYQGTDYTSPSITITVPGFDTLYVDQSVSASGNGLTWSAAYKTLGEGLAAVNTTRRVIHVAEGTYHGPFALPMRFEIYGGFPSGGSTLAARDFPAHATVLTGLAAVVGEARASAVVRFNYTGEGYTQPVMDGFTVEDGQTGLLAMDKVVPTLRHLTVRRHTATGLVLQNTTAATAEISDSVFENNTGYDGGGINARGYVALDRVVLRGNSATNGGGLYAGAATLRNVLVSGNTAATGGGLWLASTSTLLQTTVAGNAAATGSGIYARFGVATLRNAVVWGNRTPAGLASGQLAAGGALATLFGLDHSTVEQPSAGLGAFTFDPLFTAPVAASSAPSVSGNYTLRAISPAIDTGSNSLASALSTDLAGNARLVGTVDLGAYESASISSEPFAITGQPSALLFNRDASAGNVFSVAATHAVSILWQYAAPGASDWLSLDGVSGFSGATTGTLTVPDNVALNGYRFRAVLTGSDGSVIVTDERLLTITPAQVYVNVNRPGSEAGDGLSWATAYKSLSTALASVAGFSDPVDLWLAAGNYVPATTFTVRAGVSLYGGFAGTETARDQRDSIANVTALVAPSGGSAAIVTISALPALSVPARFDSLVIRDNPAGRGIDNQTGRRPIEIERVRFTGISSCTLYSHGAEVSIRRSEFRGNGGPAVTENLLYVLFGSAVIENTLFAGNHSNTRATAAFAAPVTFRNVTVAHNVGSSAVSCSDANTRIFNSVFWGNRTVAGDVTGLQGGNGANSIFAAFNNTTENLSNFLTYFTLKTNNVSFDPAFIAPITAIPANVPNTAGDYSLGSSALAIDAGVNDQAPSDTTDLAGNPRRHALFIDPGAYEFQGDDAIYAITTQPADRFVTSGNATFTIAASRVATITWEKSSDNGASFTAIPGAIYANVAAGVTNSFPVAVSAANHGHLFRARVQFSTGPLLLSEPAALACLVADASLTRPAGHGTPALFAATANIAPSSWQWQLSADGGTTFEDVPGAIAATLSLAHDASLAGRAYRAVATYAAGPVITSNAVAYAYSDLAPAPGAASTGVAPSIAFAVPGGAQPASLTDASLFVHGDFSGRLALADLGAPVSSGNNLSLTFINVPPAGERIQVTTTSGLRRADGLGLRPRVWEFRLPVSSGPGIFAPPVQVGAAGATAFALGDMNSIAWVDALVASASGLQLYSNTAGVFTASGAPFGPAGVTALALGTLTPAGALDAAAITADGDVQLWQNDGTGVFTLVQTLPDLDARALAFGDLDADGDLDLFVATASGNVVLVNNGSGSFATGPLFGAASGSSLDLGDLDQDGDLDALVTGPAATTVWLNNGTGEFTASTTLVIGFDRVSVADFDADGLLDVALVAADTPATLWRNLGSAAFEPLDAAPGGGASATLATGDINGDGIVDLVLTDTAGRTGAWHTSAARESTRDAVQPAFSLGAAALAELNGDGSLDLFGLDPSGSPVVAHYGRIGVAGAEDATFALRADGFHPTPNYTFHAVQITGLPAHGTLLVNGQPIRTILQFGYYDAFTVFPNIANVTYRPNPNFQGVDSFGWRYGTNGSPQTYWIRVTGMPDPVVATADSVAVIEDGSVSTLAGGAASVLANDTNLDPGALSATLVTPPAHGSLTFNADGTFAYAPFAGYYGADSFVYRAANLATDSSAEATVTITVNRLNDAPASLSIADYGITRYTGRPAGLPVSVLSATDSDPEDAGLLVFSLVGGAGADNNGDFVLDGALLKTSGTIGFAGGLVRSIRVRVTDSLGAYSEQDFTVSFIKAPTAASDSATAAEDTPVTLVLPGSGGATALDYQIVDQPAHGSLTRPDTEATTALDTFIYVPAADFNGTDTFTYRVTDSALSSATATITMTVTPEDDTPTLAAVTPITIDEDTSAVFPLIGADPETATLAYALASTPAFGTVQIDGAQVTYTPDANAHGVETLAFTTSDGVNTSASVSVVITVNPVDDLPAIGAIAARTVQRNRADTFTAAVTDAETATPALRVGTAPAHGSLALDGYSVTYTPTTGYTGSDSYTLIANDGAHDSAIRTVSVTVAPIPTENVAVIVYRGLYEFTDIPASGDGDWSGVLPTGITTPAHGTLSREGSRLLYEHDGGTATSDSFTYTLTNSADDIRTVVVAITISDHVISVTNTADSGPGTLRAALATVNRFAADTLAPAYAATPDWTVQINTGASSYIRNTTYVAGTFAQGFHAVFRIEGKVVIDAGNSPGFILTNQFANPSSRNFTVVAGASLTLRNLTLRGGRAYSDYSNAAHGSHISRGGGVLNFGSFTADTVVFDGLSAHTGAAVCNDGGTAVLTDCDFTYGYALNGYDGRSIIASRNGSLSIDNATFANNDGPELYVVGDGALATVAVVDSAVSTYSFVRLNGGSLSISGSLLYAADDAVSRSLNQPLALTVASLTANDSGGPFADVAVDTTSARGATITRTGDDLAYSAPAISVGADTFTYTVTTASGATSTATVTVSIDADPYPHGNADTGTAYRGLSTLIDVLANDTDDYGGTLTITAVTAPAHGTAVVEAGRIRYAHDNDSAATSDTLTYTVSNGTHVTANVTVNVTVAPRVLVASNGADSGPGTLRAAINIVNSHAGATLAPAHTTAPNWTINIVGASGQRWSTTGNQTYGGYQDRSAFIISGKVVIDAAASPGFELSSGLRFPNEAVRQFLVLPNASLTLKNLALVGPFFAENSMFFAGGAVLNRGVFVADHVAFSQYCAHRGAAFYNDGGDATLVDCSFTNNRLGFGFWGGNAGAAASANGTLRLTRVTFNDSLNPELYVMANAGQTATVHFDALPAFSYQLDTGWGGAIVTPGFPVAANDTVSRPAGKTLKIPVSALHANDTGLSGSTVSFPATTSQGFGLTRSGAFLLYQAPAAHYGDDTFTYTITSSIGITSTATVSIVMSGLPENATIAPTLSIEARTGMWGANAGFNVRIVGIPGRTYTIERADNNMNYWYGVQTITMPANGVYLYEDTQPLDPMFDLFARFFRVRYNQ